MFFFRRDRPEVAMIYSFDQRFENSIFVKLKKKQTRHFYTFSEIGAKRTFCTLLMKFVFLIQTQFLNFWLAAWLSG